MKFTIGIFAIIAILAIGAVCYHTMGFFAAERMESYYRNNDFGRDLNMALNGNLEDRIVYYKLPDRFPLDGEYSEMYIDGLVAITAKHGALAINAEVEKYGGGHTLYFLSVAKDWGK